FPGFGSSGPTLDQPPATRLSLLELQGPFDPREPGDAAVRDGTNAFVERSLRRSSPTLYQNLLGFAELRRAEHHSPLFLELGVAMVGPLAICGVFAYAMMRATVGLRRERAEVRIREAEAAHREEELEQKKLQTQLLRQIVAAVEEQGAKAIPPSAVEA